MSITLAGLDPKLLPEARQRLASLGASKQSLDNTAQAYAREVQEGVRTLLGAVASFEEGWRLICRDVLAGKTNEMHLRARDYFLNAFQERLRLLHEAQA